MKPVPDISRSLITGTLKARLMLSLIIVVLISFSCVLQPAALAGPSFSEAPGPPDLTFGIKANPSPLSSPGNGSLILTVSIPTGYHIFAGTPLSVKVQPMEGFSIGTPVYPKGEKEGKDRVLRETCTISIPAKIAKGLKGTVKGKLTLSWQGCQDFGDMVCFLPQDTDFNFTLQMKQEKIGAPPPKVETAVKPSTTEREKVTQKEPPPEKAGVDATEGMSSKEQKEISPNIKEETSLTARFEKAAKENILLALFLAFLFGILSSLTPCVYPIIPITVAYIGSRSEGKGKLHGFSLSLAFVLGLATVYSLLGTFSAKAGSALGTYTQTPWIGIPLAVLFFLLSLSMFNLFELKTPAFITNKLEQGKQKNKGGGFAGAFVIGALSGLVASPCIGPLVLAILIVVAATGSPVLGFIYMFSFAVGMGILFILVGTFSGILASLPKSGGWMDFVRAFFGAVILFPAFYFAGLYLSPVVFLLATGLALGFVSGFLIFGSSKHFFPVRVRIVALSLCLLSFLGAALMAPQAFHLSVAKDGNALTWQANLDRSIDLAKEQNRPLLMDFRADWCAACLDLERETWPSPEVKAVLSNLVLVKMDMTKNSEESRRLMKRYSVKGLPTVILLSGEGVELGRFTGFKAPKNTVVWLKSSMGKEEKME